MNEPWLERAAAILSNRPIIVLTGAGISTESGIPDYRGPGTLQRARNPIQFREFKNSASERQRYWARSVVGWPKVAAARPNAGHHAVSELVRLGSAVGVITQNVDGLHHAAGATDTVELHGSLAEVRCMECGVIESRTLMQERLLANNAHIPIINGLAPDGDADIAGSSAHFQVPACQACAGILKPNVVFFGENVPANTLASAWTHFDRAQALLVVGSSLTVFSGFRFVKRASERGMPIVILNLGPTRGDPHAALTIESPAGSAMPELTRALAKQTAAS